MDRNPSRKPFLFPQVSLVEIYGGGTVEGYSGGETRPPPPPPTGTGEPRQRAIPGQTRALQEGYKGEGDEKPSGTECAQSKDQRVLRGRLAEEKTRIRSG